MSKKEKSNWLSSKEAQKHLKIKGCDLMHYRLSGKVKFEKRRNSYFYSEESIKKLNSILNI